MSDEKIRSEGARFDITFVYDSEEHMFKFEKPLPRGIRPYEFFGHTCTLKYKDAEKTNKGTAWSYAYGTITTVHFEKETSNSTHEHKITYIEPIVLFREYGRYISISFDYFPSADPDDDYYCSDLYVDYTSPEFLYPPKTNNIVLTTSTDPATGDVTYSGNGTITGNIRPSDYVLPCGIIKFNYKPEGSTSFRGGDSAILGNYIANDKTVHLILGTYWRYPSYKVINQSVVIDKNAEKNDSLYKGESTYSISVSFTVKAEDVINEF